MKVLVTGGAGFIGSHAVEALLRRGHDVAVIDDFNDFYDPEIKRSNLAGVAGEIELREGDIRDEAFIERVFREGAFDTVIHLAARAGVRPSIAHPALYIGANVMGTFHVIESARRHGVSRLIFASSSSVYGLNRKVPFSEGDPVYETISPYAATKLACEQLCSNYAHLHGLRAICLRFFTVYGPRQRPDLAISTFTRRIETGIPIDRYGDGSTGRDYTYIDDIIRGVEGALDYEGRMFDIFNLGGGQIVTLRELIATVERAVGRKAIINELPEQPGDVPITSADISKARALLGFEPRTRIEEGIARFVDWHRATASLRAAAP